MSETKTDNGSAWGPLAAGVAGLLLGENGVFGRGNGGANGPAVTPDQLGVALNSLQASNQREGLSQQINLLGAGQAVGFGAVKDAVTCASSQNALSLCGLGNSIAQGFAATNFNIQEQASKGRELALEQANSALRDQLVEARIRLSESHNNAQHTATQVLLNQVISAK